MPGVRCFRPMSLTSTGPIMPSIRLVLINPTGNQMVDSPPSSAHHELNQANSVIGRPSVSNHRSHSRICTWSALAKDASHDRSAKGPAEHKTYLPASGLCHSAITVRTRYHGL